MPVRTYGLTHLALAVRDVEASARFYEQAFGARRTYADGESIQVDGPGPHDVIVLTTDPGNAGKSGGVGHFGFRLMDPADIDPAVDACLAAGARLKERGEFSPGHPFARVLDPDGYEIEIWFE
jgi:catechol 2,3-dioxygenase-like lactoylglutathione lyase family enzyme